MALAALLLTLGVLPIERPVATVSTVPRLSLRVDLRAQPRFLALPAPPPAERGVWVGPMFLEGRYARMIRKLPDHMQRGMARPAGVGPLHVPNGAGLGFYARFQR